MKFYTWSRVNFSSVCGKLFLFCQRFRSRPITRKDRSPHMIIAWEKHLLCNKRSLGRTFKWQTNIKPLNDVLCPGFSLSRKRRSCKNDEKKQIIATIQSHSQRWTNIMMMMMVPRRLPFSWKMMMANEQFFVWCIHISDDFYTIFHFTRQNDSNYWRRRQITQSSNDFISWDCQSKRSSIKIFDKIIEKFDIKRFLSWKRKYSSSYPKFYREMTEKKLIWVTNIIIFFMNISSRYFTLH